MFSFFQYFKQYLENNCTIVCFSDLTFLILEVFCLWICAATANFVWHNPENDRQSGKVMNINCPH